MSGRFSAIIIIIILHHSSLEFVVQPSDKVVAPNSMAHFHCVVTGDDGSYIKWRVNNEEIGDGDRQSFPYNASWYSHVNTTLSVSTSPQSNTNGSLVECVAAHLSSHFRRQALLIIAGSKTTTLLEFIIVL